MILCLSDYVLLSSMIGNCFDSIENPPLPYPIYLSCTALHCTTTGCSHHITHGTVGRKSVIVFLFLMGFPSLSLTMCFFFLLL